MRVRVFIFLGCIVLAGGVVRTDPGQTTSVPIHARVETLLLFSRRRPLPRLRRRICSLSFP